MEEKTLVIIKKDEKKIYSEVNISSGNVFEQLHLLIEVTNLLKELKEKMDKQIMQMVKDNKQLNQMFSEDTMKKSNLMLDEIKIKEGFNDKVRQMSVSERTQLMKDMKGLINGK